MFWNLLSLLYKVSPPLLCTSLFFFLCSAVNFLIFYASLLLRVWHITLASFVRSWFMYVTHLHFFSHSLSLLSPSHFPWFSSFFDFLFIFSVSNVSTLCVELVNVHNISQFFFYHFLSLPTLSDSFIFWSPYSLRTISLSISDYLSFIFLFIFTLGISNKRSHVIFNLVCPIYFNVMLMKWCSIEFCI